MDDDVVTVVLVSPAATEPRHNATCVVTLKLHFSNVKGVPDKLAECDGIPGGFILPGGAGFREKCFAEFAIPTMTCGADRSRKLGSN
jgi:hypothetical protein